MSSYFFDKKQQKQLITSKNVKKQKTALTEDGKLL